MEMWGRRLDWFFLVLLSVPVRCFLHFFHYPRPRLTRRPSPSRFFFPSLRHSNHPPKWITWTKLRLLPFFFLPGERATKSGRDTGPSLSTKRLLPCLAPPGSPKPHFLRRVRARCLQFPQILAPYRVPFLVKLESHTRMNKEKPNCVDELKPSPDFTSHRLAFAHLPSGSKSKMMGAPKLTADAAFTVQTQVTTMERRPSRQQPACFAGPNPFTDNAMVRAGGIRFPDSLGAGQRSINSPGNMFCLDVTLAPC